MQHHRRRRVQDWTGRIKSIDQEGLFSARAYGFDVTIGPNIALETYGGVMAEMHARNAGQPTNIQAGSPLTDAIAGLKKGDPVIFSGEFILDSKGCANERSITISGSFRAPQVLFRFTTINGVSGND